MLYAHITYVCICTYTCYSYLMTYQMMIWGICCEQNTLRQPNGVHVLWVFRKLLASSRLVMVSKSAVHLLLLYEEFLQMSIKWRRLCSLSCLSSQFDVLGSTSVVCLILFWYKTRSPCYDDTLFYNTMNYLRSSEDHYNIKLHKLKFYNMVNEVFTPKMDRT